MIPSKVPSTIPLRVTSELVFRRPDSKDPGVRLLLVLKLPKPVIAPIPAVGKQIFSFGLRAEGRKFRMQHETDDFCF